MTGVSVTATSSEASSEMMKAMPSGLSMRPSIPPRRKSGTKATMVMKVAFTMETRISREAS